MEGQNKHFSHTHNLNLTKIPSATEITCSGCNSSCTASVYACWPCNFILHEQCFRATRSLQHPSHPSHPLTLLPFPTYPSNSFVCNSCNQVGAGFTYCCSECEFDLHVQCAHNISISSRLTPQTQIFLPQQNQTLSFITPHGQSISNDSFNQEILPSFNSQNVYMPLSNHEPIFHPLNAYLPHQSISHQHIPDPLPNQQTFLAYNSHYALVSPQAPTNQPIPSSHIPNYPTVNETGPSFNVPQYSQVPQPSHNPQPIPSDRIQNYHPIKETVQNFNAPQNSQIPSQNPLMNEIVQKFNNIQNYPQPSQNPHPVPSNPIPTYLSKNETNPSLNVPQKSEIPQTVSHESVYSNVPMPNSPPKAEMSLSSIATPVSHTESPSKSYKQNQVKTREIMHFSHPHALIFINQKAGEDSKKCSACEEIISGSRYSCPKSDCDFHLEKSCFRYSQAIQHKSHPEHPLTLLSYASDQHGQFICSACFKDGFGFMYHCTTCDFDLHIKCASIPETVKRNDHEHPLKLFYSCPIKGKEFTFCCDDCGGIVQENWWTYYCEECDYGTHVDCGNFDQETIVKESQDQETVVKESRDQETVVKESRDEKTAVEESRDEESKSSTGDPVLDAQLQIQRLQLQTEMVHQNAQMMINMGQSISNLAG